MAEWMGCFNTEITNADGVATIGCLEQLFKSVAQALIAFAGLGFFVMLLIGGFNFLFAGADHKKLEKARGTLTGAITGLVIIALSFLILSSIGVITGIPDLMIFKVNYAPSVPNFGGGSAP